jgi:hypothetical protein
MYPMDQYHHKIHISPFPSPPQPNAPPHLHAGVNFVQPSAAQQYQNFEQMNTANPTHPANNNRKKGKNRNNNNPGQGGNHPPQHQPPGGNQNHGNQNPQGAIKKKRQGRNTVKTNPPLCPLWCIRSLHPPLPPDCRFQNG